MVSWRLLRDGFELRAACVCVMVSCSVSMASHFKIPSVIIDVWDSLGPGHCEQGCKDAVVQYCCGKSQVPKAHLQTHFPPPLVVAASVLFLRCCCSHWCRFSGPGRGQSHLRAGSSGAAVQAAAVPRRARITAARLLLQCGPDRAARDNLCGGRFPVAARLSLGQQRPGERRWRGRGARPRRGDRPRGTGRRRWPRQRTSSSCGRAAGAKMSAALSMLSCYSVLELTVGPDRSWPLAAALVSCLVLRMGIGVVFKVQVFQVFKQLVPKSISIVVKLNTIMRLLQAAAAAALKAAEAAEQPPRRSRGSRGSGKDEEAAPKSSKRLTRAQAGTPCHHLVIS